MKLSFGGLPDGVRWSHIVAGACAIIMGIMLFVGVTSMNNVKSDYQREFGIYSASIEAIKGEIAELEAKPVLVRDEVADTLYAAQMAGNKVASLQNEFQNCYKSADPASALEINYKSLMAFFEKSDGVGWSVWFTQEKGSERTPLQWTFMTNYTTGGLGLPCVWFLKDESGELVAYATSDYNGSTGLFSNTKVTKTMYGLLAYTSYVELSDPGLSDFTPEVPVDIPAGYHINEQGNMVDDQGNPYAPGEDGENVWSGGFGEGGSYAQEFAEAVNKRQTGTPSGSLADVPEEGDARFHEAEG